MLQNKLKTWWKSTDGHWSATAMQLTAPLCCREAAGNIGSLSRMQTTSVLIGNNTSQSEVISSTAGQNGLNLQPHGALISSGTPVSRHRRLLLEDFPCSKLIHHGFNLIISLFYFHFKMQMWLQKLSTNWVFVYNKARF